MTQSLIRLERSGSAQEQRIALYSCHCEALRAHLEMRGSTKVHKHKINKNNNNRGKKKRKKKIDYKHCLRCQRNKIKENAGNRETSLGIYNTQKKKKKIYFYFLHLLPIIISHKTMKI